MIVSALPKVKKWGEFNIYEKVDIFKSSDVLKK